MTDNTQSGLDDMPNMSDTHTLVDVPGFGKVWAVNDINTYYDTWLDWHNKQVEEVLDRLLNGTTTIHLDTQPNNPIRGNIEPMLFKAEIKAAIEAERNKLEAEL